MFPNDPRRDRRPRNGLREARNGRYRQVVEHWQMWERHLKPGSQVPQFCETPQASMTMPQS